MADDDKKVEEITEAVTDAKEAAQEAKEAVAEVKEVAAQVKEEVKAEKPATKAVSASLEKIIKTIEELSVLELSELVKALEEKFGVSAAAPVAAVAGGQVAEAPGEEQTTFNVILAEGGANKISVIKAVRELVPTLGLKEAKDLVDAAPKPVLEGVNKETANEAKTKLETAGAKVELK
jgi:large subunit ribosomal protein L7/L12